MKRQKKTVLLVLAIIVGNIFVCSRLISLFGEHSLKRDFGVLISFF